MTDLERAMQAGGKPVQTDLERAIAAGGRHADAQPDEPAPSFLTPGRHAPESQGRQFPAPQSFEGIKADLDPSQVDTAPGRDILGRLNQGAAAVNSAGDRMFLGAPTAILRMAGDPGGIAQGIDAYREANPALSRWTDAPAYLEGPANLIAKGVQRVLPRVAGRIANVARTGIASGLTAGTAGATESALRGDAPEDIGRNALTAAAVGHLVGTGLGGAGAALGRVGESVANSQGGKARALIEARGGGATVGPRTAGSGGAFDKMVTQGTKDADIGLQGDVSAAKGLEMLNQHKRAALRGAGSKIGAVADSPAGQAQQDVSDLVMRIRDQADDLATAPEVTASLNDTLAKITKAQKAGFNPETDPYILSESGINKIKRRLDRAAKTGVSTDEKLRPGRSAADEARNMVNQGPFAGPNAEYADAAKDAQASRKLLGITERPKTKEESKAAVNTVKNLIVRRGQNTVTAGGQQQGLADFEAKHPDIGEELIKPSLLRARADLGVHVLPQLHGGLIDRLKGLGPLGMGAALALPTMTHGHGAGGALGAAALGLLLQNRNAINGRLLFPLSRLAPGAESGLQRLTPLLEEARQQESR